MRRRLEKKTIPKERLLPEPSVSYRPSRLYLLAPQDFNPTRIYDLSELDLSMLHRFAASPLWGVGRLSSAFELSLKTDGLLLCSAMPGDGSLGSAPLDAASAMLHTILNTGT